MKEINETNKDSSYFKYRKKSFYRNGQLKKLEALYDFNEKYIYYYRNDTIIQVTKINNELKTNYYFFSSGFNFYIEKYNKKKLIESIVFDSNVDNESNDTLSYFVYFDIVKSIAYSNYGYLLTTYKYKRLDITFNYYIDKKTTYIRKSKINYRKLKRYGLTIEDVFKDLNKFFPNTTFVLYDDTKNKKSLLPDE
ncbi:MAG: hypothetical protein Q8K70_01000 [Bacteroidota bacterium]|nr:hypothetical protein [Bacteroidota bacterium]